MSPRLPLVTIAPFHIGLPPCLGASAGYCLTDTYRNLSASPRLHGSTRQQSPRLPGTYQVGRHSGIACCEFSLRQ